jgi:hypothetical protein
LASGLTGEVPQTGIGFREVSDADIDRDDRQHTSASDRFEVKSGIGEPKSTHSMSVLMPHVQTIHVPYCSQGVYKI